MSMPGAGFAMVVAVAVFGLTSIWSYIWFAFLGAVIATAIVYTLGSIGRGGATPIRLTLAGVAIGSVLGGISSGITLLNPTAFDQMRQWNAGSLSGRSLEIVLAVAPFILIGLFLALALARQLNAVALGDDLGTFARCQHHSYSHPRCHRGDIAVRRGDSCGRADRIRRFDGSARREMVRRTGSAMDSPVHVGVLADSSSLLRRRRPNRAAPGVNFRSASSRPSSALRC